MLRRIQALHNFKSKHPRRLGDHTTPEKVEFEAMRMVEGHGGWGKGSTPVSKTDLPTSRTMWTCWASSRRSAYRECMLGKASMRIAPQVPWLATPRHSTCLGVEVPWSLLASIATSRALAPLAAGSRTQPGVPTGH